MQRRHCQPHVLVLVGAKVELPAELEAVAVRFSPRLPDANALLKMVREEATHYATENGGRRVEADGEAVQQIVRNPVSYTHLDVYKRQDRGRSMSASPAAAGSAWAWRSRISSRITPCLLYTSRCV